MAYTGDCGPHPRLTELERTADLLIVDAKDRPGETEAATRKSHDALRSWDGRGRGGSEEGDIDASLA